jgi:hypothetical protein
LNQPRQAHKIADFRRCCTLHPEIRGSIAQHPSFSPILCDRRADINGKQRDSPRCRGLRCSGGPALLRPTCAAPRDLRSSGLAAHLRLTSLFWLASASSAYFSGLLPWCRASGLWTASRPVLSLLTWYCGSSGEAATVRPAVCVRVVIFFCTSPWTVWPWLRQVTLSPLARPFLSAVMTIGYPRRRPGNALPLRRPAGCEAGASVRRSAGRLRRGGLLARCRSRL